MYGGSPIDMSFDGGIDSILNMYLPGEEGGEATYELLFGKISPSGKLCESWPRALEDVPFVEEFTRTTNDRYKESIFVGYRYYSSFGVPVKYPFGYGLSYTTFAYSNMRVEKGEGEYTVKVDVENTGKVESSVVLELFVEAPKTGVIKPLRELRGFEKVLLRPAQKKEVTIHVPYDGMKYYIGGEWVLENGEYTFQLCSDVNTVLLSKQVSVDEGCEIAENPVYAELYGVNKYRFLNMPDYRFDKLIGRKIESPEIKQPYDLNTPIREYKTWGGKLIFGLITFVFETIYNLEKKGKDSPDKETKVKNAYFGWQIMYSMSLRSMSYASEGMLSHNMALALVDLANNKPFAAISRLIKGEKCVKLPE